MKLLGGCLIASASAAMSVTDWLQAKFQHTQLQGVNSQLLNNALSNAEEKEVMLNLNENSPQMGYSPLSLLVSGNANGLNKADILGNMKNNFKNQMYNQFQQSPINPLLLQYAKQGGTGNMSPLTKDQVLLQQFPDPMGTILRLKRDSNAQVRARGEMLMKKMVARNVITDDPYLPDLFIDNDKQKIKDYLFAKQLETADPYMKTLLYRKFNSGARGTGPTTSDKDLIKTKVIASQFGDTINQVTPNDAYLMFKFLQKSAAANQGRIPANIILDVALGRDVADIKANEFEEKFGVSATDYVCAAHEESIRVPCMVNQEIVQPEECRALGCCYNKLMSDGSGTYSHTGSVPICYHNLLGKIGSGIARHMINDDNIKALFGGQMPLLEDLTAAQTWAEKQMPEVLFRLSKGEGDYYGNPAGQMNWWDNMYDSTDKKFSIYATPAPKTKKREWKPHGPTAMPHAGKLQIPEVGGFLQGNDPRVNDLDFIIGNHITKIRAELNSESYTCRLIPPEMMVNCYDNNYDALSTEKNGQDPAAACADLGCCFREVNLFEKNNLPVCYRSLRSGFCDLDLSKRNANPATLSPEEQRANTWWKNNPYRTECGALGISRGECLLNPQCCYDTNPRQEGESHCYKRGGVESLFNQRTGQMGSQCELTQIQQRESCFDNTSKFGKLLNRIATEDQCVTAGCCFSQAAFDASQALGVLGTMNMAGPHCFKRPADLNNGGVVADNYAALGQVTIGDLAKVCAADPRWPKLRSRQWVKNAVTGRYELTNTMEDRPLLRESCSTNGQPVTDRHTCVYTLGCCFEKSSNPINPWCYKARLVKKVPSVTVLPGQVLP